MHKIQNEKEEKVWKSGRICDKNERSSWRDRNGVEKELGGDEKVYR